MNLGESIQATSEESAAHGLQIIEYAMDAVGMSTTIGELTAEAIEIAQLAKGASTAGAFKAGLAFGTAGVLAQAVANWIQLGGAHADAMAAIARDHLLRGFSYGAVLGVNDAKPNYVHREYWRHSAPAIPHYPQIQQRIQDIQNGGLITGYHQGQTVMGENKGRFFSDLHARMTATDRGIYSGRWADWDAPKKKEYYLLCAALFRKHHLE